MHPITPTLCPHHHARGSALLSVVIFTTVALLLIGSLLSWSMTERRLNYRQALRLEARNSAEAIAEYGFSQIRQKMETRSTVNLNPAGSDALTLPPASFWNGSQVKTASLELIGGTVEVVPASGSLHYFNPGDPNNENDPLKGKNVFRRDVRVIAKSTVNPSNTYGGEITAYVSQSISIRGAPLFAHAIFYNMDLEIFNGPAMTVTGPVHTNGSLYLYPQTGTLVFTDQVTATGDLYHAAKPGDRSSDGASAAGRTADISFPDRFSQSLGLKVSNIWQDTSQGAGTSAADWTGFRNFSSQRWAGNLQTGAHGVDNYTPTAIGKYLEDSTPANGSDDSVNSGRTLIEPTDYPTDATDPNYGQRMEIEYQKYANDSGIYILVDPTTRAITVTSRSKTTPSKNKPLTLPPGNTLVAFNGYVKTTVSQSVGAKGTNGASATTFPITTTTTVASSRSTSSTTAVSFSSSNAIAPTATTLNQGLYDQHRQKTIDLVDLDMDALRKSVAKMAGASSATVTTGTATLTDSDLIGNLTPDDWTGIVYVEIAGAPTTHPITGATNAATNSASLQTGVRIINGKGKVASYGTANEGLTIATNAPVYVKGHFNADGNTSTANPNSASTPETDEVPAAIIGDAITLLSPNFSDATSLTSLNPAATSSTLEISAALLVGTTPTNKNDTGMSSGGAHNLPRFLENWNGKTVFLRGSLVALFETRIFTEPHGVKAYYSPPTRNWGFNSMFREGRYPPGTPRVLSYRRVDFTDLTAAEYAAAKASFNW
jgi:hypothetical protein